jgi:trehalose 2-sulfotransferase
MHVRKPYDLSTAAHDYPWWQGPPLRSILICTLPRSGSTLLGEAMYFSSGLGCPLEYFHAGFRPDFEARWQTPNLSEFRDAVWRHRTDPSGTLSVKLMWRDVQELAVETDPVLFVPLTETPPQHVPVAIYEAAAELLTGLFPAPTPVHLVRRDRVRQAVSSCIAHDTGQWRAVRDAAMPRNGEPIYDADAIRHQIGYADHSHAHWRNLLRVMPEPPIAIAYEDLLGDFENSLRDLFRELGHEGPVPPPRMQRQADARSEMFVRQFLMENAQRTQAVTAG